MWISKKKWRELEKRVEVAEASLETTLEVFRTLWIGIIEYRNYMSQSSPRHCWGSKTDKSAGQKRGEEG